MEESDDDPVLGVVKWENFLQDYSKDGDYIHGFVTTESSVDNVLELYRKATKTTFCTRRSSSLQVDPLKSKNKKFCTRSFVFCRTISPRIADDGVPFTYGGMKILECQYGPKREHRRKSDIESTCSNENMRSNHENMESCGLKRPKKRLSAGVTKKKGCQAKISVWHICRLPEYVVTAKRSVTIWQTKAKERLLQDLEEGKEVTKESRFYISFPLRRAHTEHLSCGQTEAQPLHPQIIQWIEQLVDQGITTTRDVQAVLQHNVQTKMSDGVAPDEQHRAYYPTLKDIANHVYKAKVKRQAVNEAKSDDITTTLMLLDASRSLTEDAHHSHHAASYSDEAVWKVRTELHEELNAMWVSSTNCTDAAPLAELKAAIKALHDQFVANVAELRHTPKHQEESAATSALSPAKMARVDSNLYAYLTLQD
ncbi:calcium-responsive transcription factor [Hippocampus zosterae]|uniref:calcium-responsive transcription factor n=1 Tax=Hippocampus zosterae TaxID=109293 RepID=UPI00223DDC3E|nr:calcium-responsive transcription factor [Hippocampus zosterae]